MTFTKNNEALRLYQNREINVSSEADHQGVSVNL